MTAVLSNYDLAKFWTRTIGRRGERMATCITLLYRQNEGGGYQSIANIAYLKDNLRALEIPDHLWQKWSEDKIDDPPRAIVVRLSMTEIQGWILLDDAILPSLSKLANEGVFDKSLAEDVLMDWEDKAFEEQWLQFVKYLPDHIRFEFNQLSIENRYQLAWDAYVYAKTQTRIGPVTTYTKAVLPVNLLAMQWLRFAKAKFPYKKRGPVPKIA